MGSRSPRPGSQLRPGVVFLAAAIATVAAGSAAHGRTAGEGGSFVELYPLARRTCDAEVLGGEVGREVAVRYPASMGEETARRFLELAAAYQREVEDDYRMLREGLARYLGDDLYSRIAHRSYLAPPEPKTVWYLLTGERPALIWRGPPGSAYHFVGPPGLPGDRLRPESKLAGQVHEVVHWIVHDLLLSRRKRLPRWYEEGLCDWAAMHFQRWKEKRWDGGREVLARLAWDRPEIRRRLLRWPHGGARGSLDAWRERNWESDLLYSGSLGLQFAVESALGPTGPIDLLKDLIAASPETDDAARDVIERKLGRSVDRVGAVPDVARQALLESLLDRARSACREDRAVDDGEPRLAALGHFPAQADRVVPALESLLWCASPKVVAEGLEGLRYLGRRDLVEGGLNALRRRLSPESQAALAVDAQWKMAEEFARSGRRAARWFGRGS